VDYVTQGSEEAERARARETVAAAARRGRAPSSEFTAEDLAWAFYGRQLELEELEQLAAEHAEAAQARARSAETGRALKAEIDAVLREWDAAEAAERRRLAEAEARRRLGL
jgi:hypothetical protein